MALVVTGDARDLFVAVASAAAALTGLLFVAITVTPRPSGGRPRGVIHQVRSAAALLAFTNALGISLFGLVPNNNAGYPAAALGIIGTLFTLASVRSILTDAAARAKFLTQVTLIAGLLAVFVSEIVYGVELHGNSRNHNALDTIGNLMIASLFIGVARAWEFVGDRDTGIWASIAVLATGRQHSVHVPDEPAEQEGS
ncbi:MAG TPA: hypothetical protein VG268_05865 [Streptosporangiaceae bacterium]|jgi:hypothetical protein|nr:hypothetical protein [Streptosporangiaceae bacterium]